MKSIAIWFTRRSGSSSTVNLEVNIHINLWKLDLNRNSSDEHFLDIGLKLNNIFKSEPDKIKIYFPFVINEEGNEVIDLGGKLQDKKLVAAIFNENYSVQTQQGNHFIKLIKNNETEFIVRELINSDYKISNEHNGSILSINIKYPNDDINKPIYYRIRVKSKYLQALYDRYVPLNSWLDHYNTVTEMIDLRINENRNAEISIPDIMASEGQIDIKSVDFFNMREYEINFVSSNQPLHRSRKLEPYTWDSYVDNACKCEKIIAYQIKWATEPIPGINAFFKYTYTTSKWWLALRFIAILIAIGLVGGLLANWLISVLS